MWHLPDGRALRSRHHAQSGGRRCTYLYDEVTERLDMHRRYDALIKVQSETLDHMSEAVAVFGSDGRVRLAQSGISADVEAVARCARATPACRGGDCLVPGVARRQHRVAKPSRFRDRNRQPRRSLVARIERRDGAMIDLATMPLPDGATLVTFQDRTDTVNVERALRERNGGS